MAVEFRLTLAGDIPLGQVAELAAPGATETRTTSGNRMLSAALNEERGYVVDVTSGIHGYYDAEDDDGSLWVWEPETYVDVDFYMRKDVLADRGIPHMLATVANVLDGRTEDAALVLNGNWLLLTRVGGKRRKHRPTWWSHHEVDRDLA
ncbi:SitI3 family protein [Micromonospora phytophila]|uniref:SitI3 family protein n=1 Tax=Micromonospora phytophila TaxID=709888 RepID=UPI00203093B3|nr:SitI3 family protein [Micromonospora phytophila]MCM0676649.1 SitI3 family protein [Micromonospora phytophila]